MIIYNIIAFIIEGVAASAATVRPRPCLVTAQWSWQFSKHLPPLDVTSVW